MLCALFPTHTDLHSRKNFCELKRVYVTGETIEEPNVSSAQVSCGNAIVIPDKESYEVDTL